jgi:sugar lactone lactonase YvrE
MEPAAHPLAKLGLLALMVGGAFLAAPRMQVATLTGENLPGLVDGQVGMARFNAPSGIGVDGHNNLYVADTYNHRVRQITPDGRVRTFAGGGLAGRKGGGQADGRGEAARFHYPRDLTVDRAGNVYVADTNNSRICKVTPDGTVTTLAGGVKGFADGRGAAAKFYNPWGVSVDEAGIVYVADTYNHRIRKISQDGTVTTLAGSGGSGLVEGDFADGHGTHAAFKEPCSLTVAPDGTLFVADSGNRCIRKISKDGDVTTLTERRFQALDNQEVVQVGPFIYPTDVEFMDGMLYAVDTAQNRLCRVSPEGRVETVAGPNFGDDAGLWNRDTFDYPTKVVRDHTGVLFVLDTGNHRIRRVL